MDFPNINYRDYKEFYKKKHSFWIDVLDGKKLPWILNVIKFILRFLLFPFKDKLIKTFFMAGGHLAKLIKKKRFEEGYLFGLDCLLNWEYPRIEAFGPAFYMNWWPFFRQTCYCAIELSNKESLKALEEIVKKGPEPKRGYEVSASYCDIVRLACIRSDFDVAWYWVEKAVACDDSHGYPFYLRAWLGAKLQKGQVLSDLIAAIQHQPELKEPIYREEMFKDFPILLKTLKAEVDE